MKTDPFDLDVKCESCEQMTRHKSGYCSKCREQSCSSCGERFIAKTAEKDPNIRCGYCKIKGKRKV